MRHLKYFIFGIGFAFLFSACQPEGPSIDDHYLNYPVPEFQTVTKNYAVGVEYLYGVSSYGSSEEVIELFSSPPVVGSYTSVFNMNADSTEIILDVHLRWINQAKIDYLLLSCRPKYMTATPPSVGLANDTNFVSLFTTDSTNIERVKASPEIGELKFALKYEFGTTLLGTEAPSKRDSSMIVENKMAGDITAEEAMIKDFVECLSSFYNDSRMMKVDGKPLIYIPNAYRLYSGNAIAFFAKLRKAVKDATGHELFIVGQQERWSPPARFEYLLKNTVDAIYHARYVEIDVNDFNRVYAFHPLVDQNWKYSKNWFNGWGTQYVPNISPAWNANLGNTNAISPYYLPYLPRTEEFFNKYCTVAKWNADVSNLVLISSWNFWHYDSQIEPSENYGTAYLDIIKKQFKINP